MKKHNEGYTLPLVLVVMIIMCLIAVSVMSVALHNLQAQKTSITRMQDKYEAQGELEKALANLSGQLTRNSSLDANEMLEPTSAAEQVIIDALTDNGQSSYVKVLTASGVEAVGKKLLWTEKPDGALSCIVALCAQDPEGQIEIRCSVFLEDVLTKKDGGAIYFYNSPEIVYTSYEIGGAQ